MGLDAVELVIAVEQKFGVSLRDDAVVNLRTLGQLDDYLLEKCVGRRRSDCPTRSAFYRLRRAIITVFGAERKSLRPTTETLPLLGTWRRQHKWNQLENALGLALPPLVNRTDASVRWGALVAFGPTLLVATVATGDPFIGFALAISSLLPGVLLGYCVGLLALRTVLEPYRTLGGLAKGIVSFNHAQFQPAEEPPTQDDPIWNQLCDILVHQLAVRRETLTRQTRFVEDLGF
jgi:hypothetical protein